VDAFAPRAGPRPKLPSVGRERWRELWAASAKAHALELDDTALVLRGELHGLPVEVHLDDTMLHCEVRLPRLGLDLRLTRRAHAGPSFKSEWTLVARDELQAEAFVSGELKRCIEGLAAVRTLDDEKIVLEHALWV